MSLSFKDIAEILKSIDESDAEEIEIEVDGLRLAVRKRGASPLAQSLPANPAPTSQKSEQIPVPSVPTTEVVEKSKDTPDSIESTADYTVIRAPMVGTFYRRPDPESEPFVEQGSVVNAGDPLCLIEVMKLYTTIESTAKGVVESIFVEDGSLVEFNQQLFLIKH